MQDALGLMLNDVGVDDGTSASPVPQRKNDKNSRDN